MLESAKALYQGLEGCFQGFAVVLEAFTGLYRSIWYGTLVKRTTKRDPNFENYPN